MSVNFTIEEIGSYKKNLDLTIEPGAKPPKLNPDSTRYGVLEDENKLDLNLGVKEFKDNGGGEKLETILEYIKYMAEKENNWNLKKVINSDFVTTRGTIRKIAQSGCPSNEGEPDLQLIAVQRKGVIFLLSLNQKQLYLTNGLKFQQYMTLDDEGKPFDKNEPISNESAVKYVYRAKLENGRQRINLFYGAEVDAIDDDDEKVELKVICKKRGCYTPHYSILRTYLQCLYGNVQKLVVGSRYYGTVYKVEKISRDSLKKSSDCNNSKLNECNSILHDVLSNIKKRLSDGKGITANRVNGQMEYPTCEDNFDLVPDSFLSLFES